MADNQITNTNTGLNNGNDIDVLSPSSVSGNDIDNTNTNSNTNRQLTNIEIYNQSISTEEHKERCRRAGFISGEKRREKRTLKAGILERLQNDEVYNGILDALVEQCLAGNHKAFETLRDTAGEKPTQEVSLDANIMTEADRQLLENVRNRLNI